MRIGHSFIYHLIRSASIALLILFSTVKAFAQLNESDTARFQVKLGLNGIYQTGNVNIAIWRSRLESVLRISPRLVFKTQNNTLFQSFAGFKADEDYNSRNYLYWNTQSRLYPFAMAYLQSNFRLKINSRFFTGVGFTWQALRYNQHIVKLSTSMVYEQSRFSVSQFNDNYYNGNSTIELWRPTFYLAGQHLLIDNKIKAHYTAYWQGAMARVKNYRWYAEVGADINLIKGLWFTLQYINIYEHTVAFSAKQLDAIFTLGLAYQFKNTNR